VARLVSGFPALDIPVNSASTIRRSDEHRRDISGRVLSVNLTGTMRTCTAAGGALAARGGCIVNIASMPSFFGGGLVPAGRAASSTR